MFARPLPRWVFSIICGQLAVLGCGLDSKPPVSSAAPTRAAVVREERVSPTTVILDREDGTSTAVITAAPRAWREGDQGWRPIDTTLRRVGRSAVADQNLLVVRLPARLGEGQSVRLEDRQSGAGFSWRPRWPDPSEEVQLAGEIARYPLGGSQVGAFEEFHVLRGAVKHNLVLTSADALERVLVETSHGLLAVGGELLLDPGLRLQPANGGGTDADGSFITAGGVDLVGPRGTLLALPAPRAFELGGTRRSVAARYRWSAGYRTLSVEVDAAWLRASDRSFPLAIDPPATVLSSFTAQVLAASATGPGTLVSGPDSVRVGALNFGAGVNEFYQFALKFDVSAINSTTTISAVSVNVFYATSGTANSQVVHFARLTRDPETTDAAPMWTDGAHLANPDYAVLPTQANDCGCWINAGNPATQTGTTLGAIAVADLQAALPSGRFLLGMHVPAYVTGREAEPHGLLQPNEPQLYVDFTTGVPSVSTVTPAFTPSGTALTATVIGTNFTGQAGSTAALVPILGGAPTPVVVTSVSAGRIRISVPVSAPIGIYDVVVTTAGGSSPLAPGDRFAVLAPVKTWNGSVSTAWSNSSNWTPAGVPDLTTDVTIPGATPFSPTNDVVAGASVHALSLTGGTLLSGGRDLTVTEDLSIGSGTLDMTAGGTLFLSGNNFLSSGAFIAGTGTVNFSSPTRGRQNFVATGKVFFDDFERAGPAWTSAVNSGAPTAWALTGKYVFSPITAWYQQGQQTVAGSATLASPSFSLAGKTTATLRWKHRYRINLEDGAGPNSGDGFVVQVSTNGGTTWTTIAPNATSVGPKANKATGATCPAGGGRTQNPVVVGPAGMFAGIQTNWIQESVSLNAQAGQPNVRIRFWSGWDNCNDFVPYDGVYLDDVSVTADETPLAFNHLTLSSSAQVTAITPLQVNGDLNVRTANNQLDVNGAGLTVLGSANNAGTLLRGPAGAFSVAGAFTNSGTVSLGTGPVTIGAFTNSGTTTLGTGDLTTANLTNSGTLSTGTLATVVNGDLAITAGSVLIRGASLAVTGNVSNNGTLDTAGASTSLTGTGATTVTGSGQYKQSATRQVLFYDGFETGTFATGGWVATAGGVPADAKVVATPPGVGAFVANLSASGGWIDNWITKARSTLGQSGIWLTFGRATTPVADTYLLTIEYSLDGGASWKTAKSIPGTFGYVSDAINLSALDPAVDNNAGFQFRFHSNRQLAGSYHYLDEVRLEAGTAGLGPLTILGGGTKTIDPTNAALELVVAGPLTLSAGTLRIAGGKALSLDARQAVTSTSAAGTVLHVDPNATLKLSGGTTLTLTGTLELLGLTGLPAKITTTDTLTPGRYALNVGGTFNGGSFDIDYANALGLNLAVGCTVTALNGGAFHRPPAGGALLTLATTTQPAVSTGCSFANELGVAGAASVDDSLNASAIRFDTATGALAGEPFDRDFGALTPGNVTWGPVQLAFTAGPLTVAAGSCNAVTVQARDQAGSGANVAANIVLGLASTSAGNTFYADAACAGPAITTSAITAPANSGTFYFRDTTVGTPTVTVSAPGFVSISQTHTINPGPAARVGFTVQPSATQAGALISPPVQVAVQDALGNTITSSTASITVAIGTNPGGGTLSGTLTVAAVAGVASFSTLSINRSGAGYTLTAAAGVLTVATSGAFTITPGAAAQLAFTVQPSSTAAGVAVAPAVQVSVQDALGNTVTSSTASLTVAIGTNPGGGALSGALMVAAVAGVASFSDLSINKAGTGYTLTVASGLLTPATSAAFTIGAGAATQLAFTVQPSSATAGVAIAPAIQVTVQDAVGNTLTSSTASVTVAIGANPGAGTLSGTATVAAVAGIASFSNLSINRSGIGYILVAAAGVLTSGTSLPFDITPGAATQLAFIAQPLSTTVGVAIAPAVQVAVQDTLGNLVTSSIASITIAIGTNAGAAALSGTATLAAVSGVASFSDLSINKAGTGYTLTAASGAVTSATSLAFNINPATSPNAPKIARDAILTAAVGLPYAYNALGAIVATGTRPLAFAACGGPSGFKVDALTGAVTWTPNAVGPVPLCVKATNAFGEDTVSFTVQVAVVAGQGPIASFTVSPPAGPVPLAASFDGSASTADASSALAAWRWDYGDFAPLGTGQTSAWEYLLAGGYQPMLTVIDAAGRIDSTKRPVQVRSAAGKQPPLARIIASALAGEGSLSVDFSCDCQPGDAAITAWRWDFADAVGEGASLTRVFTPGRYRVHLTAVDGNGLTAIDSVEISVAQTGGAQPPRCQAQLSPPSGMAPLKVTHLASAGASTGQIASVLQSFGDGGSSDQIEVERQYDAAGRYPVKLTVADDQGLSCHDSVEVVVIGADGAVAPRILSLAPATTVTCGQTYVYAAAAAGSSPFVWSLAGSDGASIPDRMTIDETGKLTWPASSGDLGVKRVRVSVSNAAGSDEQTVEIEASCGERARYAVGCGCSSTEPAALLLAGLLGLAWSRRRRSL